MKKKREKGKKGMEKEEEEDRVNFECEKYW